MDTDERRKFKRINLHVAAGIFQKKDPKKRIDAEILDISEGGAFVHCAIPIRIGEEIVIEIRFNEVRINGRVVAPHPVTAKEELNQKSVVRWFRGSSHTGFGVEFVNLPEEKRELLRQLIDSFSEVEKTEAE